MPIYEYICTECGYDFERLGSFNDPPLAACPECEGRLRRVISPAGVIFKGSGWYITDSRRQISGKAGDKNGKGDAGGTSEEGGDKQQGEEGSAASGDTQGQDKSGQASAPPAMSDKGPVSDKGPASAPPRDASGGAA